MENIVRALGVMFLHSIWQGFVITGIAILILKLIKDAPAYLRYRLLITCFLVLLSGFSYTLIDQYISFSKNNPVAAFNNNSTVLSLPFTGGHAGIIDILVQWCSRNSFIIVSCWLIVFVFKITSVTRSLLTLEKIKNRANQNVDSEWQQKIKSLVDSLHIRIPVFIKMCPLITQPMVIGFLKPVIFIPIGLLTQLPPAEAEAILLHELAHIKRNDFFVNLLQTFTECIFFFNPGLIILSSLIRTEREYCCDELAIEKTGDKKTFLKALLSFHDLQPQSVAHAMAINGPHGLLGKRVYRILRQKKEGASGKMFLGIVISCIAFLLASFCIAAGKNATNTNNDGKKVIANTSHQSSPLKSKSQEPEGEKIHTSQKAIKSSSPKQVAIHDTIPDGVSKEFIEGYNAGMNFRNHSPKGEMSNIEKKLTGKNTQMGDREEISGNEKREVESELLHHTKKYSDNDALAIERKAIEQALVPAERKNK